MLDEQANRPIPVLGEISNQLYFSARAASSTKLAQGLPAKVVSLHATLPYSQSKSLHWSLPEPVSGCSAKQPCCANFQPNVKGIEEKSSTKLFLLLLRNASFKSYQIKGRRLKFLFANGMVTPKVLNFPPFLTFSGNKSPNRITFISSSFNEELFTQKHSFTSHCSFHMLAHPEQLIPHSTPYSHNTYTSS